MIILKKLPIPPSQNKQLTVSRGRFIKLKAARIFDDLIKRYQLTQFKTISQAQKQIASWLESGKTLQIELYFVFHENRVLTKTKKAKSPYKKIDSNNRIKSSIDAVSKILGIDDMIFFKETSYKVTCSNQSDEQLIAIIQPLERVTYDGHLKSMFNL
jgi:hypothetical protein